MNPRAHNLYLLHKSADYIHLNMIQCSNPFEGYYWPTAVVSGDRPEIWRPNIFDLDRLFLRLFLSSLDYIHSCKMARHISDPFCGMESEARMKNRPWFHDRKLIRFALQMMPRGRQRASIVHCLCKQTAEIRVQLFSRGSWLYQGKDTTVPNTQPLYHKGSTSAIFVVVHAAVDGRTLAIQGLKNGQELLCCWLSFWIQEPKGSRRDNKSILLPKRPGH